MDTATKINLKTIAMALSLALVASFSYGKTPDKLESALRSMHTKDVTIKQLGGLFSLRESAPNPAIQNSVIRACGAGLLFMGQNDRYGNIKNSITDVADFEKRLFDACGNCQGTGGFIVACDTCRGNGRCRICGGTGSRNLETIGEGFRRVNCTSCKRTGRCGDCNGEGKVARNCATCRGQGGIFSRANAMALYRSEIGSAIKGFEDIREAERTRKADIAAAAEARKRAEDERLAKIEHEKKLREVELAAAAEAQIAEAKARGEAKARIAAQAEREEMERKRKAEEDRKFAAYDKDYLKSIVVIEGDRGVGTGFLCDFHGKRVLLSNRHVLLGNRTIRFRTTDGTSLRYTHIHICRDRDIVAFELEKTNGLHWLTVHHMRDITNQENVVVFGNSAGGGVVTTLRGQMKGIGPAKIEIDAEFVQGNSGSPIIAYPYNAIIGMATYMTRNPKIDWTNRSTRFADVRRFGVRIDNVAWNDFFRLDTREYNDALDKFEAIIDFVEKEVLKMKWRGRRYIATGETRIRALDLLREYNSTPEWMREHADDARIAAYVCALILDN